MATINEHISKSGKKSYRVRVKSNGRVVASASFPTKTEAKRWGTSTEAAIRERRHFPQSESQRHTLADAIERYLTETLPHKQLRSAAQQRRLLGWWRDHYGDVKLADMTASLIIEGRDTLSRTSKQRGEGALGPASVTRHLAALGSVMTAAVKEWQWLNTNPVVTVTKPTEPRGRTRYLTPEERDRLLEACRQSESPDLYPAVCLALTTGARRGEALGIEWRHVDFGRKTVHFPKTKNGDPRTLPLVEPALSLLLARFRVRRIDTPLVFPNAPGTGPVDLKRSWATALRRAAVEDFRWHDLRHTTASYLAMNGASTVELAGALGHKTLAMVKRYSHLSADHIESIVGDTMGKVFGGER